MRSTYIKRKIIAIIIVITLCFELTPPIKAQAAANAKEVLNQATLTPTITNYKPLDKLVKKVLKKSIKDKMSTYEKVLACYDYLINNMSYSSNIFNASVYNKVMYHSDYSSNWDKKIIYYAYSALKNKKDSCYGSGKLKAKKSGTAYITAIVGNKTAKCKIKVKKPFIKLNKSSITLKKPGKKYRLKTKVSSNLKKSTIKWKSSNKEVVTVTKTGKIKAIGKGKATITARIGKLKVKCKVKVK